MYSLLKAIHLLSIILWIGGMLFAHFFLRPSLGVLEPKQRLLLMHATLGRFFTAVVAAALAAWISGAWMMAQATGGPSLPWTWTVMAALGSLMVVIFGYIRFGLYRALSRHMQTPDIAQAAQILAKIRFWVGINLAIGIAIILSTVML